MQPLRISRMARRIDDFQFRMNRVCRLLSYVLNAHRDPTSINQKSNKKSPGVKLGISRFTYRFHSVLQGSWLLPVEVYSPVFSVEGALNLDISSSICSRDSRRIRMSVNVCTVIGFSVLAANARASRRLVAAASRESLTGVVSAIRWKQLWGKRVYLVYSFSW